eukprot:2189926-Pleurochrysis_carterae.AAC.1
MRCAEIHCAAPRPRRAPAQTAAAQFEPDKAIRDKQPDERRGGGANFTGFVSRLQGKQFDIERKLGV